MPTNAPFQPQGIPRSGITGHESRDANAKWVFAVVGFLLVTVLAIHFIVGGLLGRFKNAPTVSDAWRLNPNPPATPPLPHLQISPPLDLQSLLAREEIELTQYGWINKTAGVVRIPIEKAMDLVLQEGFAVRSATNTVQRGPSSYELIQQRLHEREPPRR